jgi:hypothetical protein
MNTSIKPWQVPGELMESHGLDMALCDSESDEVAAKWRAALMRSPEGRAHVAKAENRNKEGLEREKAAYANLLAWAERLATAVIPFENYQNDARPMLASLEKTVVESMADAGHTPVTDPPHVVRTGADNLRYGGWIGTWDGYDLAWQPDHSRIDAETAAKERESARRKAVSDMPDTGAGYGMNT